MRRVMGIGGIFFNAKAPGRNKVDLLQPPEGQ